MNVNSFVFMGLPGGLDYLLLVLVKMKLIDAGTEKSLNQSLNVWIRSPLGCVIAFIMVFGAATQPDAAFWPGRSQRMIQAAMGIQLYWNGKHLLSTERQSLTCLRSELLLLLCCCLRYCSACPPLIDLVAALLVYAAQFFMYRTVDARTRFATKLAAQKAATRANEVNGKEKKAD